MNDIDTSKNSNSKSNTIKAVILICLVLATSAAIIYGICSHVLGVLGGTKKLGNTITNEVIISDDFTDIYVSAEIAEISIVPGNELKINYSLPEKLAPSCEVTDSTLNIISKGSGNVNFNPINMNKTNNFEITITVPADFDINNLHIELNVGEIKINAGNYNEIDLNSDLGDIDIRNVTVSSLTIDSACGDVEASNINTASINVSSDLGDIKFDNITCDSCNFESSMGDTEVSGTMKNITVSNDMGDIKVRTANDEAEVNFNLDVDMGNITVNGHAFK